MRGGRYAPPVHGAVQTAVGVRKTSVLDVMRRLLQVGGCGYAVCACERERERERERRTETAGVCTCARDARCEWIDVLRHAGWHSRLRE